MEAVRSLNREAGRFVTKLVMYPAIAVLACVINFAAIGYGVRHMLTYILAAMIIVTATLLIPEGVIDYLSAQARYDTPNRIQLSLLFFSPAGLHAQRVLLTWIGLYLMFRANAYLGFMLIVYALFTLQVIIMRLPPDRNQLRNTMIGRFADRLTVPVILTVFAFNGCLNFGWLIPVLALEIAGALVMPPISLLGPCSGRDNALDRLRDFLQDRVRFIRPRTSAHLGFRWQKLAAQYLVAWLCLSLWRDWCVIPPALSRTLGFIVLALGALELIVHFEINRRRTRASG